jgi:hypothetical protein
MANPRIRFALGSHVQFENLDFICTGVDYDLVLLPLTSTSTPSLKPCLIIAWAQTRGRPPRMTAQEVPKAKRRQPVSHMTMGGPVASLRLQYDLIRLQGIFL